MSNGFKSFLYSIGTDKYIHFTVCLILSILAFAIGNMFNIGNYAAIPAIVVPLVAGLCKEISDKKRGGTFDNGDIAADFLGMFVGLVLVSLILIGK